MDDEKKRSLSEIVWGIQSSLQHPSMLSVGAAAHLTSIVQEQQRAGMVSKSLHELQSADFLKKYKDAFSSMSELSALDRLEKARQAGGAADLVSNLHRMGNIELLKNYSGFSSGTDWIEKHKNSFLLSFLTGFDGKNNADISVVPFDIDAPSPNYEDMAFAKPPKIQPKLEAEIVEVLKQGRDLSELSKEALQYFWGVWGWFWEFFNKCAIVITVVTGILYFSSLDETSSPQVVRETVKAAPAEIRQHLVGNSIVTGEHVIVRAGPDKRSSELVRLKTGAIVENLGGDTDGWVRVLVDVGGEEVSGWIARRYVLAF